MLYNSLTLIMMLVDRKNRGYDSYFIIFLNFSRIRQKSASWPPILMKKCLVHPFLLTVTADCFDCSKSRFRLWKNSYLHPRLQRYVGLDSQIPCYEINPRLISRSIW